MVPLQQWVVQILKKFGNIDLDKLDKLDKDEIKMLQHEYSSALDILDTQLLIDIEDYEKNNNTKIVEHYNKRRKDDLSVLKKLQDKKCKLTVEEIRNNIKDIAGIRIICPFTDDTYKIVDLIKKSGFQVYEIEDYIENPKESGYQGIHLGVKVPVRMGNEVRYTDAEVQVRTVAMDAWAAVEHRVNYKPVGSKKDYITEEDKCKLVDCSRALKGLEQRMKDFLSEKSNESINLENNDIFDEIEFDTKELEVVNFKYYSAIKKLKTHLREGIKYLELVDGKKKVEHYNERIKTLSSTLRKLKEKECDLTIESLQENIRDYAGVRLVCPFIDDIYDIVDLIKSSDLFEIYEIKDYIKNPKESGYQSVHLLVNVPLNINNEKQKVKVEIQLRTLSMDAWAAIEERIKYLVNNNDLTLEQLRALKTFAGQFKEIDEFYNELNSKIKSDSKEKIKKLKKK